MTFIASQPLITSRPLLTLTLLLTSFVSTANAQCKDGVCRLPGLNDAPEYSRGDLANSFTPPQKFGDRYAPVSKNHAQTNGFQQPAKRHVCEDCNCQNGACECGPNCATHCDRRSNFDAPQPLARRDVRPSAQRSDNRLLTASYRPQIQWGTDYAAAIAESRRTGRPILLRASAKWCQACQRMKKDVWTDPTLNRDVARSFITVDLDADIQRDLRLLERLKVKSLPTLIVITPELRIVDRIEGYQTLNRLRSQLRTNSPRVQLPLRDSGRSVVLR